MRHNGQLIGAGGIIEVRPPSLAEMLNRSTSVEHIAFSPPCANEMLAAVIKLFFYETICRIKKQEKRERCQEVS